jgi:RNA polymerase sigma-70 factor (ECF subfamily)
MTSSQPIHETMLDSAIRNAYLQGVAAHGDLGLAPEDFIAYIKSIIAKRLGPHPQQDAVRRFVANLHADDLYLAAACAHNSASAWSRLAALYDKHIEDVSHADCSTHQEARDLASTLLGHLFFRNRQGHSRIASYEGRCSLRTWLSTIIKRQAINQRLLKSNEAESLDSLRGIPNPGAATAPEAVLFQSKYGKAIADSFKWAGEQLSERERLVLALRFEDEMRAADIAKLLHVHPAQITRTVKHAEFKLHHAVLTRLTTQHGLGGPAIEECIEQILENGEASIASLLHVVEPSAKSTPATAVQIASQSSLARSAA